MKIIKNTLKAVFDRWEDPGDYPNAVASGPLPPGPWQVVEIEGEVVLKLKRKEMKTVFSVGFKEFLEETDGIDLPEGVLSVEWQLDSVVFSEQEVTISCEECEPDPEYRGPEPPDHEDY